MTSLMITFIFATNVWELPPGLLSGLCYVESHHKVKALNPNDGGSASIGVCQIKLATAKLVGYKGNAKDLRDSHLNVYYAGKYLKQQIKRYNGDIRKAVAAYNSGTHKLGKNGDTINSKYVERVFKAWAENR